MKYLICILLLLISPKVLAEKQDIVAIVNTKIITMHDFNAKKKMITIFNKMNNLDILENRKSDENILNLLIEEELLDQHVEEFGESISGKEISNAISIIEEHNTMPKGYLLNYIKELDINLDIFNKQLKSELIKHNIINILSKSVSIYDRELDLAIIKNNENNFDVLAWQFTSFDLKKNTLKQMQNLGKGIFSCNALEEKIYNHFAVAQLINSKLKDLDYQTKSVILNTKENKFSKIYQENNKFKLVFVCAKKPSITKDEINKIKLILEESKVLQKIENFFKELKSRAYIKILFDDF